MIRRRPRMTQNLAMAFSTKTLGPTKPSPTLWPKRPASHPQQRENLGSEFPMSRPDPIQYAERLYAAIVAANFSTMSCLAFGNAVKDGVELRRIPRIAAEPFMRVV